MLIQDTLPSYDHLVIVGNGFDLNLGLSTSYSDFIKSQQFRSVISDRKLNNIFSRLEQAHTLHNWIDVENELKLISKSYNQNNRAQFKQEFNTLKNAFSEYLTETLSIYSPETGSKGYAFMEKLDFNNSIIVNFNYTDVISHFMANKPITNREKRVIHIHGDYKKNNLILGVEDGTDLREGQEFLLKSAHLNYVGFNMGRLLKGVGKLTIFGHSLGQTDDMYFKDFFNQYSEDSESPYFDFNLYYYNEDSLDSLMGRINTLTNERIGKFRQNLNFNLISSM